MTKTLDELINAKEPGWPVVREWLDGANKPVEVLDVSPRRGAEVLLALQVTTRSPMGAIAFQTGGLLVDHGWVRILGGGCARMEGDLARWNGLGGRPLVEPFNGAMLVAHDVLGGFFALDGGALGEGRGAAYYLAPDTLEWERLVDSYSELVAFLLTGDLAKFYEDFRWPGWEKDVAALSPDRGYSFVPPLFARDEGPGRERRDVPMVELLGMNLELADAT
ncbi:DUF2625 family protein [Pyxidicoccus fallax]|uniref:DUF2625 family protein n=1 Tax=Pyxidicoccus fallax TaxID=394095 RepID=A0A848LUW9_9BACT|nr:DUF2625 family protein [Pyxidicoccus fallax]NMO21134.1 DUF2625 family protein [Pyxidicoccus fallax]NPC85699.1 DUF2625 family protein [Pyxidicoccus fallax]